MAEELHIPTDASREQLYESLLPQIRSVVEDESDEVANMANVAAVLREAFGFFWIGFYRNIGGELVLGPFQGPLACTRIAEGKGVCGSAMAQKKTLIVPNVEEFPGHIACSSRSRSEIVVPGLRNGQVVFVLDIDSEQLAEFSELDQRYLEQVVSLLL